jgi:hypothetical protein
MELKGIDRQFAWNSIVVIESMPEGERTGEELVKSILRWRAEQYGFVVLYAFAHSREDFIELLKEISSRAETNGLMPIIHIEAHGMIDGLKVESGETVSWAYMNKHFQDINRATKNNLLLVFASCYATEVCSLINVLFRAPFWGALAPVGKVSAGDIQVGFVDFYEKLIGGSQDFVEAVCALNQYSDEPPFEFIDSEAIFHIAWDDYLSKSSLEYINDWVDFLIENKNVSPNQDIESWREELINRLYEGEAAKTKFYRFYMMLDLTDDTLQQSI